MGEMMDKPHAVCLLSFFPFRPAPSCLFSAVYLLRLVPPPAGRGMCGLTIDLRLRA